MSAPSATTLPTLGHCRECGVPLSPETPDGFCPSCMLEGALRLADKPCEIGIEGQATCCQLAIHVNGQNRQKDFDVCNQS